MSHSCCQSKNKSEPSSISCCGGGSCGAGVKSYRSDNLSARGVVHGFYTRRGGASEGLYAGLNLGAGSNDDADKVQKNLDLLKADLGADHILTCRQVHSASCHIVTEPWSLDERPEADALICGYPGIAIGVLTADCAPVLFTAMNDDAQPIVAAAHAGWKGALGGVLENTLLQMMAAGAASETIRATVGPCIAQKSYEVNSGFAEKFLEQDEDNERFFTSGAREGHPHFDLSGYCASRLARAGVGQVDLMDRDTYSAEDEFYSYRRATHRGEDDYGRQISVIMIQSGV